MGSISRVVLGVAEPKHLLEARTVGTKIESVLDAYPTGFAFQVKDRVILGVEIRSTNEVGILDIDVEMSSLNREMDARFVHPELEEFLTKKGIGYVPLSLFLVTEKW